MDEREDFLSKIMDAGQPEMPAGGSAQETGAEADEGSLPNGAPIETQRSGLDGERRGSGADEFSPQGEANERSLPRRVSRETSAPPERERRIPARLGYAVTALLAANLLALLAVCLIQLRANRAAMDTVEEALDSLRTVERLEEEKERLQERVGELEATEEELRTVIELDWAKQQELEDDRIVAVELWLALDAFEAERYEECADILRYLFYPATGIGHTFRAWGDFWERVVRMVDRLEELGYLEEGDVMLSYLLYQPAIPD